LLILALKAGIRETMLPLTLCLVQIHD
jgi:hypothetical protein